MMVETGVKKYDELPSRLKWKDIDYARWEYIDSKRRLDKVTQWLDECVKQFENKKVQIK